MANAIATIPILDALIKDRYLETDNGKVSIGAFWSILQIYQTIKLGVSPRVLCEIASMVENRLDHQYTPTTAPINPATLRTWLQLKSIPKQIGHTTVTKTVAKGCNASEEIKAILVKYNSYGPDILREIVEAVDKGAGKLINMNDSTQGASDFIAVLSTALAINDAHRKGALDLTNVLPSDVRQGIIDALVNQ